MNNTDCLKALHYWQQKHTKQELIQKPQMRDTPANLTVDHLTRMGRDALRRLGQFTYEDVAETMAGMMNHSKANLFHIGDVENALQGRREPSGKEEHYHPMTLSRWFKHGDVVSMPSKDGARFGYVDLEHGYHRIRFPLYIPFRKKHFLVSSYCFQESDLNGITVLSQADGLDCRRAWDRMREKGDLVDVPDSLAFIFQNLYPGPAESWSRENRPPTMEEQEALAPNLDCPF